MDRFSDSGSQDLEERRVRAREESGGRLGGLLGRKRIYHYDLLLYAFGTLWMVFTFNTPMLFIGTFLVGVAVGADVPTSLALVGEFAPSRARSKLLGLTQVAWSLGPIITLLIALVLATYGLLGIRIVFAHLFVVAIVTWALRRGMVESAVWTTASGAGASEATSDSGERASEPRDPLAGRNLRNLFNGYTFSAVFLGNVARDDRKARLRTRTEFQPLRVIGAFLTKARSRLRIAVARERS